LINYCREQLRQFNIRFVEISLLAKAISIAVQRLNTGNGLAEYMLLDQYSTIRLINQRLEIINYYSTFGNNPFRLLPFIFMDAEYKVFLMVSTQKQAAHGKTDGHLLMRYLPGSSN